MVTNIGKNQTKLPVASCWGIYALLSLPPGITPFPTFPQGGRSKAFPPLGKQERGSIRKIGNLLINKLKITIILKLTSYQ